tara:strand:+ start:1401 stop:1622 length:222 start_codon:yes stop_codon:yes gene_type:complete
MYDTVIKKLEERIKELESKCEGLENDLDDLIEENAKMAKLARAVCEIQEELVRSNPTIYIVNKINAPTRVGME